MVARLADTGRYLGSESSFYRVLKQNDLLSHRHNSKPRVHCRPKDLAARSPNQVWSWDITYLNSPIRGAYYYLYLVEDIFSRDDRGLDHRRSRERRSCGAADRPDLPTGKESPKDS